MLNQSPVIVQELLGHADIRMTMRYSHLSDSTRQDAMALLDEAHAKVGHYMGTAPKGDAEVLDTKLEN